MRVTQLGILVLALIGPMFGLNELEFDEPILMARARKKKSDPIPQKNEEKDKKKAKKILKPKVSQKSKQSKSRLTGALNSRKEIHDLAFSLGYNIVESFGRLPYFNIKYDYFFVGNRWFAEADVGLGYFLKNDDLPLYRRDFYDNDLIFNIDFTLAYSFGYSKIGYINKGSRNVVPFVLFGPTLIYQGGFFNPGGVVGIGSILYPRDKSDFTFHYGVKDKMYFPKVYTTNFITHNIHLYIGLQYRFKS